MRLTKEQIKRQISLAKKARHANTYCRFCGATYFYMNRYGYVGQDNNMYCMEHQRFLSPDEPKTEHLGNIFIEP